MALKYYQAYQNSIAQAPVDDWRETMQQSINDTWEDSSTLETVQGQTAVGGIIYADESVYLNSVINPSTGENFGDEYRKIFYRTYADAQTNKWLGKMYQFEDKYWLTTNTNTAIGAVTSAVLRKCNNILKWYANDGTLKTWQCVFSRNLNRTMYEYGREGVPQSEGMTNVLVQYNDDTKDIFVNQRFILDGHAFQVQQIDNHYSQTLMTIYIFETQVQSGDDLVNNIAYNEHSVEPITTELRISPNKTKILLGESSDYSVFAYQNGTVQSDVFTITSSGVDTSLYELTVVDGNHFSVLSLGQSNDALTISCEDTTTHEAVSIDITLGGAW